MNELTTVALKCLIRLITTAFTVVIIPYIRQKMGEEKWLRFMEYIEYAVRCAEQIYTPEEWEELQNIYCENDPVRTVEKYVVFMIIILLS